MTRARLSLTALSQVDLSTPVVGTNVVAAQRVWVYEEDGTTPIAQLLYATSSGGSPIPLVGGLPVLTADNSGNIVAYTPYAQRCTLKRAIGGTAVGASFDPPPSTIEAGVSGLGVRVDANDGATTTGSHAISGPRPWFDCFTLGARPSASAATNTAAIQAAIAAAIAAGGGRIYLRGGNYHINGTLAIFPNDPFISVELFGDGPTATIITQDGGIGVPDIALGQNGAGSLCQNVQVRNLKLVGGRAGIQINNSLFTVIEDVYIEGCDFGLLGIGQNEHIYVHRVTVDTCTTRGILMGASNGSTIEVAGDDPELQKSLFDHIFVSNTSNGPAIEITAGTIIPAGGTVPDQQSSGSNVFRLVQLEGNHQDQMVLSHCFNTTVEHISDEIPPGGLAATNTYSVFRVGTGCSDVTLRNARIAPSVDGGGQTFKYGIEVLEGLLMLEDSVCNITAPAGTADVYVGASGRIRMRNVAVTDIANVTLTNPGVCHLENVMNGTLGTVPLTAWPANYSWMISSTDGIQTGRLGVLCNPSTYPFQVAGSAGLVGPSTTDVGLSLDSGAATGQGQVLWKRSTVVKWQAGMSVDATPNFDVVGPSAVKSLSLSGANGMPTLGPGAIIGTGSATIAKVLTNTVTWDPPNLVSAAATTTPITVTGAVLGDHVLTAASLDLQALTLTAYVSAADTVQFVLANNTAGAVNLGSGTFRATILRVA